MTRVVFLGSKQFGLSCLKTIYHIAPDSLTGVITYDDSADTRTALEDFHEFSRDVGIRLQTAKDSAEAETLVCNQSPDLCLVSGWYWIISEKALSRVPRGFLGFHNSLLPRYRGGAPLVWSMINGDTVAGTTLFSFNKGIDDGVVWAQGSVAIETADYIADVTQKVLATAIHLLQETWPSILSGKASAIEQDEAQATYSSLRIPDDGQIDWKWSAQRIRDFIRAQSKPYPGAFTKMPDGRKLTIWRARCDPMSFVGTPGQIARITKRSVYIICGDNRPLVVQEVALDGTDLLQPNDILKSLRIRLL